MHEANTKKQPLRKFTLLFYILIFDYILVTGFAKLNGEKCQKKI